jgi:predicted nucleic-acid-binding protein
MMIGLDTNILVRLLVKDDPVQTAQAKQFVDSQCTRESPGFVNCVVLAELVWALSSIYGYDRGAIVGVVEGLLTGDDRVVEHREAVWASLEDYKLGKADFIDAVIVRINRARGCDATATFDRKASRIEGAIRIP